MGEYMISFAYVDTLCVIAAALLAHGPFVYPSGAVKPH